VAPKPFLAADKFIAVASALHDRAGCREKTMAVPGRLELPTFGLGNRCSIRLSYGTNWGILFLGTF
jgi:hypothetical protein